jgi:FlaA1/EpsC-like NDP-sugar epimerase
MLFNAGSLLARLDSKAKGVLARGIDAVGVLLCAVLTLRLLESEFWPPSSVDQIVLATLSVLTVIILSALNAYRSGVRFIGEQDFINIALGVGLGYAAALVVVGMGLAFEFAGFSPGFFILGPVLTSVVLISLRFGGKRLVRLLIGTRRDLTPALVFWGDSSALELAANGANGQATAVIGLLAPEPEPKMRRQQGLNVYGFQQVPALLRQHPSLKICVRQGSDLSGLTKDFADLASLAPGCLRIVPMLPTKQDRARPPIPSFPMDMATLIGKGAEAGEQGFAAGFEGKSVLVTGGGGSIGAVLCLALLRKGARKVIATDRSELALFELEQTPLWAEAALAGRAAALLADITDARQHAAIIDAHAIDDVIHTAAHKHVGFLEDATLAAVRNNVWGTKTMLEVAQAHRVQRFTFVSTDKAVLPTSVLGATKMWGEVLTAHHAQEQSDGEGAEQGRSRFSTIRLGNVLGSAGSVLARFDAQIRQGGPVTVRDPDLERYFITLPQVAERILQGAQHAGNGKTHVVQMGQPLKILDLARWSIQLAGHRPGLPDGPEGDIDVVFTALMAGEKLQETPLLPAEMHLYGKDAGLVAAHTPQLSPSKLAEHVASLEAACETGDSEVIRTALMNLCYINEK